MRAELDFACERNVWNLLFERGAESKEVQKECTEIYNTLFPDGYQTKDIAKYMLTRAIKRNVKWCQHLNDIDPDAIDFLLEHGKAYRPYHWRREKPHLQKMQPTPRECFLNTYRVMCDVNTEANHNTITYVEGIAFGPLVQPMLHAWNGRRFTNRGLDWSFYASTRWTYYFGIPFTQEEYQSLCGVERPGTVCPRLLFHKNAFTYLESHIRKVLTRPRTRLTPTPLA